MMQASTNHTQSIQGAQHTIRDVLLTIEQTGRSIVLSSTVAAGPE